MASAISVLLAIPVSLLINYVVVSYIENSAMIIGDVISHGTLAVVAVILFLIDYFSNQNND